MSNRTMAGLAGTGGAATGAAAGKPAWAAEDLLLLAMLPYGLAGGILLLCGPIMLVAWGVSELLARGR